MSATPESAADDDRPDAFYGPTAVATWANLVTVARLLLSPVLFGVIANDTATWAGFALWVVLALTDGIDGYLARRYGTTRSGAFLDPLADKVLVLGALFVLVGVGRFWWVPVALIGVRELAVSLFRSFWARRGLAVPATGGAKLKTLVQALAVGFALLPLTEDLPGIADALLWVAVALTLATGLQYLTSGRALTTSAGDRS